MSGLPGPADERGSTIIELLVGMAMGMIVLAGLSMVIITTLHGNGRVTARVEATQNARLTVSKIIEQLHSACASPRLIPLKSGSSPTELIFLHSETGKASLAAPPLVESKIALDNEGTLWETEKGQKRKLIENVGAGGPNGELFSYFAYQSAGSGRKEGPTKSLGSLNNSTVGEAVYVKVMLNAEPRVDPVKDPGSDAIVWDSATLRLTPPLFNTEAVPPCQ
jgi:hypothetical protein